MFSIELAIFQIAGDYLLFFTKLSTDYTLIIAAVFSGCVHGAVACYSFIFAGHYFRWLLFPAHR